ncbi:transcriptional regulator [Neobacillus piezotolerans]|uniref:Transcriptional regulator n=1 Tax=Neobacillus piezotolerans TaxID=2259171 RepID=A0A3D8GV11_9BACI|nr:metalloregulator ArsR/SmtB family transcription factor [Neobacillus piezotolerans]RDU38275.1 transcriptional regulator [Neobacillus piezotolerans]
MAEPRKPTKERILELLKKEASVTVASLTNHLNITHMAIRKHLNALETDGLVASREARQPMGRPLQIYSLTTKGEALFPKNYEGITLEFLQDIQDLYGEGAVNELFQKREKRLTEEYSRKMAEKPNQDKIEEIVSLQNEKGYMAAATKIDNYTYELVEYNCPILAIANHYKTACKCETQMLKNVLKTEDISRVSCKADEDDHCRFRIAFNANK